jgi:hypothetical protein
MNIRLDKDVRIRLDQEDVNAWEADRYLKQQYKFGMISVTLELKEDLSSPRSHVLTEKCGLTIIFNSEDSHLLCNNMLPKSGISLSGINIQIDKWDVEKRKRFEGGAKEQKV